ncbi:ComF family protein [Acinetobacter shaoyimingii]|uniref:ComF family protein n=1 Tax=Acinetobacter shaoyimingii TaxID=2715164 RepID=A0A6G8RSC1_9GAMM|nr:phosphoribosyltransferase family protein [Acinetobacter shaoyimingii]NHB56673.1 ComF family protein [Acinetobacter shaoyimingii]QIO04826.1 ComF family protein [Acinetobacter shaoyimingii]
MFNLVNHLLHRSIQRISPCLLCGLDTQQAHSFCTDCWQQLPWFKDQIIRHEQSIGVVFHYEFPVDRIIQKYKYEQQLQYQIFLMHSLMQLKLGKIDAIVPMPISTERLKERGYNQMLVIAKLLSKQLKIPVWQPVIRLAQHSQKGLTRVERLENIENQFQIMRLERRKYRRVLMIDDVVTTGSSIFALKQALEKLGCKHIEMACIAAAEQ